MNIYLRKILKHDITHQISVTKEILNSFFNVYQEKESAMMKGRKSGVEGTVTFLLSTDPRFGGDIKQIIKNEGDLQEGDILLFVKEKDYYTIEIINNKDSRYETFITMMDIERHLTVSLDDETYENVDENHQYLSKEWFKIKALEYVDKDAIAKSAYEEFQAKYSIEVLNDLQGEELLDFMFLGRNDDNLCFTLEYDTKYSQFGSVSGGSSYNYYLYYSKKEQEWKTSYGGEMRTCSTAEAVEIGTKIRDAIVLGGEAIVKKGVFSSLNDYSELLNTLENMIPEYVTRMWVLKYFHMMFPASFPNFYSEIWQRFVLYNIGIIPSDSQFIRMGQINLFAQECGISNYVLSQIIHDYCGSPKAFFRLGTGDDGCYFDEWVKESYVAIGWNELGDLGLFYNDGETAKENIIESLKEGFGYQNNIASKKYKEINNFYSAATNETYVVAMNGQKVLGIGLVTGNYYFDEDKENKYAHCRKVEWTKVFKNPQSLPGPFEGKLTTFFPIVNGENVCYLYDCINHSEEDIISIQESDVEEKAKTSLEYITSCPCDLARNRILFGAPGTGKSHTLNAEVEKLIKEMNGEYERVTFHPDYSYANFVGTYKPVPSIGVDGNETITYKYVPGPFMRVLKKALENANTPNASHRPFVLVIEEINRANVAAVFGDVFQLLDRDEDGCSEYKIEASEDLKKHLAGELHCSLEAVSELRIPNNMFIWATMNSADQGVFPMDTAFKRRWDFTYLGIDNGDENIAGKSVTLGKGDYKRVVEWNKLRKAINAVLSSKDFKINEDKLMGPYFLSTKVIPLEGEIDANKFTDAFKSKVIMYLFEDAAKQKKHTLFSGCSDTTRYSSIRDEFDTKGVFIFCDEIHNQFPAPANGEGEAQ